MAARSPRKRPRLASLVLCLALAVLALVPLAQGCATASTVDPGQEAPPSSTTPTTTPPIATQEGGVPPLSEAGPVITPEAGGGDATPDVTVGAAKAPTATSLSPTSAVAGTASVAIAVIGADFVQRSVITVDTKEIATTFVSATELHATIPGTKLATVGTLAIAVSTAPPGGGVSASLSFGVVNPVPSIASLSPTSAVVGSPSLVLVIAGARFASGAAVRFGGTTLATTYGGPSTLTATLPAAQLATSGNVDVTVVNPAPGGGTSAAVAFTVSNPALNITSVTPNSVVVGASATSITVSGNGFVSGSTVQFNGTSLSTTFSAGKLVATVPAPMLATTGDFNVTVTNPPPPTGNVSAPITFHVQNPTPVISSLSPTSAIVGQTPPVLTVIGTGFVQGSQISVDNATLTTSLVTATQLSAPLTALHVANAAVLSVRVVNPQPGGGTSAVASLPVQNPVPSVASVSPQQALVGAGDTTVTITGSGFVAASEVRIGTASLATTFGSGTTLTAVIPASRLAAAGTLQLSAFSPSPGGGPSATQIAFTVANPVPTIQGMTPSSAPVGAAATAITVTGSGFVATTVLYAGTTALATTFGSATQLQATLPASMLAQTGNIQITATSPSPGGGQSAPLYFSVSNPSVTITSLSPTSALLGASATPLTVIGSGFVSTATIAFNGTNLGTTFGSATQLTATIPSNLLTAAGSFPVTVTNPPPGGGTSAPMTFTVLNPAPVLGSVAPLSIAAGSTATTIVATGSNFRPSSIVRTDYATSTDLVTTFSSSTQLVATIPPAQLASARTLQVTVFTPLPGGGASAPAGVAVTAGCSSTGVDVQLGPVGTTTTRALAYTFASAPRFLYSTVVSSNTCPLTSLSVTSQPYAALVVQNTAGVPVTLSAWAVCASSDDAFMAFYRRSTVPTTDAERMVCTGTITEGSDSATGRDSLENGGSTWCPGLTKANGGGISLGICETAVVLVQPYGTTGLPTQLRMRPD